MIYVTMHAAWMVLAVVIGTVAGYQGLLRATQGEGGRSPFPGRFKLKPHVSLGTIYYVMVYVGLVFGFVMHRFIFQEQNVMPPDITRWHAILGVSIGVLYGAAWVIGGGMTRKPAGAARGRPRLHMVLNFTACTLIGLQIALAIYYVWIWPNL